MSDNGSSWWPTVAGTGNPFLKDREHTLKRIFNEIRSVGDADASSRSPAARQLVGKISIAEPAYKFRRFPPQQFNDEKLITPGPPSPTITVKHDKAQLTVFYGGTVNVYDDISADKAHAIMLLAANSNARPVNHNYNASSHTELPFARKVSLLRFLEKRKERLQVKTMKGEDKLSSHDQLGPRIHPSTNHLYE